MSRCVRAALVLSIGMPAACATRQPAGVWHLVSLEAADTMYRAGAEVAVWLHNRGASAVGYNTCSGFLHLERAERDSWRGIPVALWPDTISSCVGPIRRLKPGDSVRGAALLPGDLPAGTYRINTTISGLGGEDDRGNTRLATPAFRVEAAPGPETALRTGRAEYRLQDRAGVTLEAAIAVTYVNRTDQPRYIRPCGEADRPRWQFQRRTANGWAPFLDATACPLLERDPIRVDPGGVRTDTIPLRIDRSRQRVPEYGLDTVPGAYRIVYLVFRASYQSLDPVARDRLSVPAEERASNVFRVVLP